MISACQTEHASCGSCCGIYNLRLEPDSRAALIKERTRRFSSVNTANAGEMAAYRQEREQVEASLPRFNEETYVCPYFGIPRGRTLAGCMIHPAVTGNPHSQNFSFYGASICQAYDCPNKERDLNHVFSRYAERFARKFPDAEYGQIMSDTRLLSVLLERPGFLFELSRALDTGEGRFLEELDGIVKHRLEVQSACGVASFEFRRFTDIHQERMDVLGAAGNDLYSGFFEAVV
jgi:hypothetical protein